MRQAKTAADDMEAALASSSVGGIANWYAPENIFKLKETQDMIDRRLKGLVPEVQNTQSRPPVIPPHLARQLAGGAARR